MTAGLGRSTSRPANAIRIPLSLTVVYDDRCQLCQRCRAWLLQAEQLVPIYLVAASDTVAIRQLGLNLATVPVGDELVVVGQMAAGEPEPIWIWPDAFITCLWALTEHRQLATRLQSPGLRHVAKAAFHALSLGRGSISTRLDGAEVATAAPHGARCETACEPGTPA